jgi:hypothetical protein
LERQEKEYSLLKVKEDKGNIFKKDKKGIKRQKIKSLYCQKIKEKQ